MIILELIKELERNPQAIQQIEEEVTKLAAETNCDSLYKLGGINDFTVQIFLFKILEQRIKSKRNRVGELKEEIEFVEAFMQANSSSHAVEAYAMLALYCWPSFMPNFYNSIQSNLHREIGYEIFGTFLEQVNQSAEIDEKRRTELKKATQLLLNDLLPHFDCHFPRQLISIYTQLLKVAPRNLDYSLIYQTAPQFPQLAVQFFTELGYGELNPHEFTEMLKEFPADQTMCEFVSAYKNSSDKNILKYMYDAISFPDCFLSSIAFWTKIFSSSGKASGEGKAELVHAVLLAVLKNYSENDDELKFESEGLLFGLFMVLCKNYPSESAGFLKNNSAHVNERFAASFIQKLGKSNKSVLETLKNGVFHSNYLNVLIYFSLKDPTVSSLIDKLDLSDKENVRLAVSILETYNFTNDQLTAIYAFAERYDEADEIRALIHCRLNVTVKFDSFDQRTALRFYYYLKRDKTDFYKNSFNNQFYSFFLSAAPFDRCFAILEKLGTEKIPLLIYQKIYEEIEKFPLSEISCFNNDLLLFLPTDQGRFFVEKELQIMNEAWLSVTDYREFNTALRSLIQVLEKTAYFEAQNYFIELVNIEHPTIVNKLLTLFIAGNNQFDTKKAVYNLIVTYNQPNMTNCQSNVSIALSKCILKEDGPICFSQILNLDINKCVSIRTQMMKLNRKNGSGILRNLIKNFKAKTLSKVYENEQKVQKHDFLKQTSEKGVDFVPDLRK
ncbi:hypothetical protein NUSPORA_02113 [Nucleospora cyclopteri]